MTLYPDAPVPILPGQTVISSLYQQPLPDVPRDRRVYRAAMTFHERGILQGDSLQPAFRTGKEAWPGFRRTASLVPQRR